MLKVFILVLQSSLEVAFVVAVLFACLEASGLRRLLPSVKRGLLLAVAASAGLAYGMETFLQREPVEGMLSLLAMLSASAFAMYTARSLNKADSSGSHIISPIVGMLVSLAAMTLVAPLGLDVALVLSRLFTGTKGLISTELALKLSVGLSALAMSALLGIVLCKILRQVRKVWIGVATVITLLIFLVQEAANVVQIALVRGVIPLTDWLFRIIAILMNNYSAFYYALFATISVLVLLAVWERRHHRDSREGLNPAQQRRLRGDYRRIGALTSVAGVVLGLVVLAEGADAIFANRPLELSPAAAVTAQNGTVTIPMSSLSDGKLYRFSYQARDGTSIRFLAVHKGSGIVGVGLDACEFCGAAGYRQDGKNVICNRCGAAINIVTIGFPGGCNPIPLDIQKADNSVAITVEVLEKAKGVFAR